MSTPTTWTAPSIGDIVYLASYVFQVQVMGQQTTSDTPNQYSANFGVMGDQGDMDISALQGPQGTAGQAMWQLRIQNDVAVSGPEDLPGSLTNTPEDIGKYYQIDELDAYGHVISSYAWVWYGTSWIRIMMGTYGPPGPVPNFDIEIELIDPSQTSVVTTSGGTMDPSWVFKLAIPAGPPGPPGLLYYMRDFNETVAPVEGDVIGFTQYYTDLGEPLWGPVNLDQVLPNPYSVPESAFSSYTGVSQQANVGSFQIPAQPWEYTPIVWGHIGGNGLDLSTDPFRIGCQVLLGDPTSGIQVARGIGTTLGLTSIYPHYSYAANTSAVISPNNNYVTIPADTTDPAQTTLYINLWNDGQLGIYIFHPTNAQLFVLCMPLNPTLYPNFSIFPIFSGEGTLSATVRTG